MHQAILNSQSTLFLYEKNPLKDQHCNLQSRELVHSAVQCIRSVGESITGTSNTLTNQVLVYTSTITSTDTLHYVPVLVVVPVQIHCAVHNVFVQCALCTSTCSSTSTST